MDGARPTFDDFVIARGPALLRQALVLTGDRHLAEDLVQEVLARLCLRWDRVLAADSPEAYVRTSMTRQYLSWRRRRSSRERVTDRVPEEPPYADGSADAPSTLAGDDVVWRLLATLPRRQRAILALRFYDDQSDAQIAAILGVGVSTVRAQASRGIARLREQLATSDVTGGVS